MFAVGCALWVGFVLLGLPLLLHQWQVNEVRQKVQSTMLDLAVPGTSDVEIKNLDTDALVERAVRNPANAQKIESIKQDMLTFKVLASENPWRRLAVLLWMPSFLALLFGVPTLIYALGTAIAWVVRGFSSQ